MPKFKFYVSANYVGSAHKAEVEITDEELEGIEGEAREEYIEDYFKEWMWNRLDTCWAEIKEED